MYMYTIFIHRQLSMPGSSHYSRFTITLRHTTVGSTPPDEWSARPKTST